MFKPSAELCGFRCPERLAQLDTNTDLGADIRRELIAEAASRMSAMVVAGHCSGWCSKEKEMPKTEGTQVSLTTGAINGEPGLLTFNPDTNRFIMKKMRQD